MDDSEYFEEVLEEFYDEHERYPGTDELIRWHRQYFQAHTIVLPPEFFEARGLEVEGRRRDLCEGDRQAVGCAMRRNHVEARRNNFNPPCQYVSETHDHKPSVPYQRPREYNAMTLVLWRDFILQGELTRRRAEMGRAMSVRTARTAAVEGCPKPHRAKAQKREVQCQR